MRKRIWSILLALSMVLTLFPIGALAAEHNVHVGAGQKAGRTLSSRPSTGFGIDVSHHQGEIDWNQVKGNIAFAIIRCGFGDDLTSQDDRQFQRNADACEELGIPYGIYFYSYAVDDSHMQSEVSHVLRLLQGRKPSLPVYLDLEESSIAALGNDVILRHARAFCSAVANAGFRPGVYANYNWWTNYLTSSEYNQWSRWLARYDVSDPGYSGAYDFWQYSSKGYVAGISGYVDLNYSYCEIPKPVCTHSYTQVQETAATCTADGVMRFTCSLCGDSYTQTIPALGHDWKQTVIAPTCTEAGGTLLECSRCAETMLKDETPALGHSYENGVCIRCGAADPRGEPVTLRVGSAAGKAGDVIQVPVTSEDNPGFSGFALTVQSDDGLVLTDVAIGELLDASASGSFTTNIRSALVRWKDSVNTTGDGVLFYLTFKLSDDAANGEYTVSIARKDGLDSSFVNAQGKALNSNCIPGTVTVSGEPVYTNPFKDVPAGKFYTDAVLWAVGRNPQITNGYSDGTFRPDLTCTRAQVVTFLWRAKGCPEPTSTRNPFTDVKSSDYFYKAVLWAAENGVTTGKTATTFDPNGECTRAHVITFLWRVEGKPTPSSASVPFTDVPTGKYYTTAVLWALQKGITTGRTANTFGPDDACTRGHVVTFLYRDMT